MLEMGLAVVILLGGACLLWRLASKEHKTILPRRGSSKRFTRSSSFDDSDNSDSCGSDD